MNIRLTKTVAVVALLGGASLPAVSAAQEADALNQCVRIFINEVVPANYAVEIKHDEIIASTKELPFDRKSVDLVARGDKRGKLFGRGTCVVNRDGSLAGVYAHQVRSPVQSIRPKVLFPSKSNSFDSPKA